MIPQMGPMAAAVKAIDQATTFYVKDLEALSEDQILLPAAGNARAAVDFTFETAFINRQIAARLRGDEPIADTGGDEWVVAPEELRSKLAIIKYASESFADLLDSARGVTEEEAGKMVGSAGRERPAFALANFAAMHTMYHDAQLNFIQSLNGDLKMHWN